MDRRAAPRSRPTVLAPPGQLPASSDADELRPSRPVLRRFTLSIYSPAECLRGRLLGPTREVRTVTPGRRELGAFRS
jgi:hypothetical protein